MSVISSLLDRLATTAGRWRRAGEAASESRRTLSPGELRRLGILPETLRQGRTNACGPCSLAMAASCFWPRRYAPEEMARRLRLFRVPGIGATLPWGIVFAGRAFGLDVRGHWFGRVPDLKRCVDAGHPAIVLVHPDDFAPCPWYALHYRVLVGYRDDSALDGGGELYFACSAAQSDGLNDGRPGNVVLSYTRFQRQWRTWLTINWYAEVARAY